MPVSLPARILRLFIGWSVGAAVFVLLVWGLHINRLASQPDVPGHLDEMIKEIAAPADIPDIAPVANNKETLLLYARNVDAGFGLFLANLAASERKQIAVVAWANVPPRLIGWSPDDRYLAFAATDKKNQINQHILIRDGASGAPLNAFDLPAPLERGVWLSTNSLVLSAQHKLYFFNFEKDYDGLGRYGDKGLAQLSFDSTVASSSLVPIDGHTVAYDDGKNIWLLNIPDNRATALTQFTNASIRQLDYSPENKAFLFSLATNSDRRADPRLYRFNLDTNSAIVRLAQVADKHDNYWRINYGKWLAKGGGVAFATPNYIGVSVKNDTFYTNLFSGGYYWHFSVSPQGDKIFALASVANEPLGIWEYDLTYRDLANVVPPKEHLAFSQWAAPAMVEIVRTNAGRLDYSLLAPPNVSGRKKYPAVLNLLGGNPADVWPQFLANAGVFCISGRPRSAEDARVIIDDLLKLANVDPQRLYLVGQKTDAVMINGLLESNPTLWRGVILMQPSEFPQFQTLSPIMPQVLVFGGSNRDLVYALKAERFVQAACQKLLTARLLFDEDIVRAAPKADLYQERCKTMAKFILTGDLE